MIKVFGYTAQSWLAKNLYMEKFLKQYEELIIEMIGLFIFGSWLGMIIGIISSL